MNETFKPTHQFISHFFGNRDSFYRVPDYQRPYSWGSEQVEQLWDDLFTAYDNNDDNYFLGTIILTPSEEKEYFDVIDGQQRITTLIILFCAIKAQGGLSDEKQKQIEDAIHANTQNKKRLKLKTELSQQNYFEQKIIKKEDLSKISGTSKERKEYKYLNTAMIFNEKIKELGDKVPAFVDYLFNKTTLIKIECTNKSFAIKLFQVLNNRGLELSQADLVKSFLLGRLGDEQRPQFISTWNAIKEKVRDSDTTMENILTYYEYYLLASNPQKALNEEVENWLKKDSTDSNAFIQDMSEFSEKYVEVIEDAKTYPLRYLPHQVYSWPILTAAKRKLSEEDYKVLCKKLVGFYYSFWIAGYTSSTIKQFSFNLIGWVKDGESIDEITEKMQSEITKKNVSRRCRDALNDDVYGEKWLKPLLATIEYWQTDESISSFIPMERKIHVEHILPQENTHHSTYGFGDDAETYVHRLANLTLLSGRKNIQASNAAFADKKSVYTGMEKDGITGFRITQQILNHYTKWTKENYDARKKWLYGEIEKILIFGTKLNS